MNKIEFTQFLQNTKDNIQEKLNPKKISTKISVSLKSKKTRKNLIIYAFLTLFCIAFLLLLSASTSPLYKDLCDGDSSIFRKSDNARQGCIQRLFWPQRSDFVLHKCIGIFPDKIKSRRIHTTMYIPFNIFDIYVQNGTFFHKTDTLGNLCYNHHSCIRCDNQWR